MQYKLEGDAITVKRVNQGLHILLVCYKNKSRKENLTEGMKLESSDTF